MTGLTETLVAQNLQEDCKG